MIDSKIRWVLRSNPEQAAGSDADAGPVRSVSPGGPTDVEVRAQLEKVVGSAGFRNSERMRRFLRIAVERTLDGATDQLKEFSIGHDVFDRGEDYDPRTDSIVRVEARRLRKKLRAYYEGEGLRDKVVIAFHPGTYVPTLSHVTEGTSAGLEKRLDPKTVAVLPFSNLSSDLEQYYFCDGISEDIIDALSTVRDLRVLGRGTTFTYRDPGKDPRAIGAELGAGTIVEGSVRKSGGMLRVSARLIDTETGHVRWSTTVDRVETDIFAIKDEIATAITSTLCDQTSPGLRHPGPVPSIEAYALYLKGRHAVSLSNGEGFRAAIDFYSRAIAKFPNYAPPYSGLAQVYTAMASASVERPSSLMPIAKRAVLEALRLDPALAHAYTSLAWVTFCYEWNWAEGLTLAKKAVVLEPNYAFGHYAIGALFMMLGRISEARAKVEYSLRLDPLSISAHRMLGLALTLEDKFDEAERRLLAARALAADSHELAWMLSTLYLAQGRMEEGLHYARECQSDPPVPRTLGMLGQALARAGREQEAREILRRIEEMSASAYVDPWTLCRLHTAFGENEKAIECLARSFEERSTFALYAHVDPLLEPLRKDARFGELIARLNMPTRPRSRVAKR